MPGYTVSRVIDLLNRHGLPISGTEILAVGISYKPNIADDRESASLEVLAALEARGARITVIDPVVGRDRIAARGHRAFDDQTELGSYQMAIVLTDHDQIDYRRIADHVPIVFDTRGIYRRLGISGENIHSL
jgi:UDP-N-acetyl-D-glucosamine dehydrogenase